MKHGRCEIINGNKIEEFYWAGELVVYVNNMKFDGCFEEAVEEYRRGESEKN